jgi:hypothetical protein
MSVRHRGRAGRASGRPSGRLAGSEGTDELDTAAEEIADRQPGSGTARKVM